MNGATIQGLMDLSAGVGIVGAIRTLDCGTLLLFRDYLLEKFCLSVNPIIY